VSGKGRPERQRAAERAARSATADDPLAALVAGTWPDPETGQLLGVPIASIVVEPSLRGSERELVAALGMGRRLAVVSDPATQEALGQRVEAALAGHHTLALRLDPNPHADVATVERVRAACADRDALIAVGSGTINDVCKYAAAQDRKPYAVFATAPSMNGYTSVNAAITVDGHKHTLPAAAPRGVFVDLEVLARAPKRMIRAGIGDSICRPTAQLDWLMSHLVLGTPYREAPFALLAADEAGWVEAPEAVLAGDAGAMRALARTLLLSGLGMTLCGGSYPASQGEHLVSHYIDMFAPPARADYLHGEQVAVATLAMARLQERVLAQDPPEYGATQETEASLVDRFGEEIGRSCWRDFSQKALSAATAHSLTARLREVWSEVRAAHQRVALGAARIENVLRRAGAPVTPDAIGVSEAFFERAMREARYLRNRLTFLDLKWSATGAS
jgi:glycerol-1-phosphate dehydrogenase [NAD(P)+]